jgi:hypothetical protein
VIHDLYLENNVEPTVSSLEPYAAKISVLKTISSSEPYYPRFLYSEPYDFEYLLDSRVAF